MRFRSHSSASFCAGTLATLMIVLVLGGLSEAQIVSGWEQVLDDQNQASQNQANQNQANQNQANQSSDRDATVNSLPQGEEELQQGSALTRRGAFAEAIPHLLAARGRVANEYAADFNLALCYVGTSQFKTAIEILNALRASGRDGADVENLLAQSYIGNAQPQEALTSLLKAAALSPQNEKLYAFVADACMEHQQYRLGLEVVAIGLRNLSQSAWLHYERAMLLAQLDELDQAKQDFEIAAKLGGGSEIGVLASAHEELLDGNVADAIRTAREGVKRGFENPALLTILGEALMRSGASPGQPDFVEAQTVLEKAVLQRPNDVASQIALGNLYLVAGRLEDALAHLEKARQIAPGNPSVYAKLAKAYQRRGDEQQARDAIATLQKLNQEQADRISSAPGDRKLGYAGAGVAEQDVPPQHR
jgi:tetratricopeptide (TPR) repeat protein